MDSAAFLSTAGLWLGFLLSLLAFSAILGDHLLARLAQHMLVGAALGYLLVLIVQNLLRPHLIEPLLAGGTERTAALVPLGLALLLLGAGLEHLLFGRVRSVGGLGRQLLRGVVLFPLLLLLGMGLATAAIGAIQGTLLPQIAQAAAWDVGNAVVGLFMLLIATGVLLHLYGVPVNYVEPVNRTRNANRMLGGRILQQILGVWTWLGQRMLWLAAGVIFARLVAARWSLLIARFEYMAQVIQNTPLGRAFAFLWPNVGG